MNTVDKLNNILGWLTAMSFDKPELSNDLEEPLNVLSEVISEVENLAIHDVVFNGAPPNSKEHQAKLLSQIMQSDEELSLYSEVELPTECVENWDKTYYCKSELGSCKKCS